ncbi:MAG: endo-1,4-beta-xylanase [Planctomycetota bacterium]
MRSNTRPWLVEELEPRIVLTASPFNSLPPPDLSNDAVLLEMGVTGPTLQLEAEQMPYHTTGQAIGSVWALAENGSVGTFLNFSQGGSFRFDVSAAGSRALNAWTQMTLIIDGQTTGLLTIGSELLQTYSFEASLNSGLHEVRIGFVNDAMSGGEDRNLIVDWLRVVSVSGQSVPAVASRQEWQAEVASREDALLATTDQLIEQNRKGNAGVLVVDEFGNALQNANVSIQQLQHSFLFGANLFMYGRFDSPEENQLYLDRFSELFNFATVPFYWNDIEPVQGSRDYGYVDALVSWATSQGIQLKGHPLLWNTEAGNPAWADGLPSAGEQEDYVREVMERYADLIQFWDVVNEPFHNPGIDLNDAQSWARQSNASASLILNEYGFFEDGAPLLDAYLQTAIAQGVSFDAIGIQAHDPLYERFSMAQVWEILEQYSRFGKSLHVSELAAVSGGQAISGSSFSGTWSEAAQAEYVERYYRTLFANPAVDAISWWDLADAGSVFDGGGLLRNDLSSKPVYDALHHLIKEEWWTNASGKTNAQGAFDFRGFFGTYEISVTFNGKTTTRQFEFEKNGDDSFVIVLSLSAPVTANAGGPYFVNEGGSLSLDGSGSMDPNGNPLIHTWDINGDGIYGDATGVRPTVSWTQLATLGIVEGPSNTLVRVRVTDVYGHTTTSMATTLSVRNAGPAAQISGPASAIRGFETNFHLFAVDPSPVDQTASFTFSIDWNGDGTFDQSVTGSSGMQVSHAFGSTGTFNVRVQATDKDGTIGETSSYAVHVSPWALVADGTQVHLVVGGSEGDDQFEFEQIDGTTLRVIAVMENGVVGNASQVMTGITGNVIALGFGGKDLLNASSVVSTTVHFFGGAGNDTLRGGKGDDYLLGQEDADVILGNEGDDVIDGGSGADLIYGEWENPGSGTIYGRDSLHGGDGDDTIYGDGDGGEGTGDLITGDDGNDVIYGDGNLASSQGIDSIFGGMGDDTIYGDGDGGEGASDVILGDEGDDTIYADGAEGTKAASDTVSGGSGNDLIVGDAVDGAEGGADSLVGEAGQDTINAGSGDDFVDGGEDGDLLFGGNSGNNTILGGSGKDVILGGRGADTLVGGTGEDLILAGQYVKSSESSFQAIFVEWSSARPFNSRVENIQGVGKGARENGENYLVPGTTVLDDQSLDTVYAGVDELDWILLTPSQDLLADPETGDRITNLGIPGP